MARSFNGSSDLITTGTLTLASPFSFFAWIKPSSLGLFSSFFGSGGASNFNGLQARLENSDKLSIIQANAAIALSSSNTANNGVWNTAFGSFDGTNAVVRLNGTKTTGTSSVVISQTCPYFIGAASNGAGIPLQFWPGSLADMAVWNVILTDGEAAALEFGERPVNIRSKSLLAWWPIDGIQSPEADLSGNAINGTLTGTAFASGPPATLFTPRWPIFTDVPPSQLQLMGQIWM